MVMGSWCCLAILLVAAVATMAPSAHGRIAKGKAELIVVVESSIPPVQFNSNLKSAINRLYATLNFKIQRASLVRFADWPQVVFPLNAFNNLGQVTNAVNNMGPQTGGRNIGAALYLVRRAILPKARCGVPVVVVVFITGVTTGGPTLPQSEALRKTGAIVLVAAVGKDIPQDRLLDIAKTPDRIIRLPDFPQLNEQLPPFVNPIGNNPNAPIELTAVAEASLFLNPLKTALNGMFDALSLRPGMDRTALVSFADDPILIFNLNNNMNPRRRSNVVNGVRPGLGGRNVGAALDLVRQRILPLYRPGSQPIVVVFITGVPVGGDGLQGVPQADALRNAGVTVIAVGVGFNVPLKVLTDIAGDPRRVMRVPDPNALPRVAPNILQPQAPPRPEDRQPIDLIALAEGSSFVPPEVFNGQLKRALNNMFGALNFNPANDRAALIRFADDSQLVFNLGDVSNLPELTNAVNAMTPGRGDRNVGQALDMVKFSVLPNVRPGSRPVVILFLTGPPMPGPAGSAGVPEAAELRNSGVIIVTVGIGRDAPQKSLQDLAGFPTRAMRVPDFLALIRLAPDLLKSFGRPIPGGDTRVMQNPDGMIAPGGGGGGGDGNGSPRVGGDTRVMQNPDGMIAPGGGGGDGNGSPRVGGDTRVMQNPDGMIAPQAGGQGNGNFRGGGDTRVMENPDRMVVQQG